MLASQFHEGMQRFGSLTALFLGLGENDGIANKPPFTKAIALAQISTGSASPGVRQGATSACAFERARAERLGKTKMTFDWFRKECR